MAKTEAGKEDMREKRLFFRFTVGFHKKLKILSAKQEMTMTAILERLVNDRYAEMERQEA